MKRLLSVFLCVGLLFGLCNVGVTAEPVTDEVLPGDVDGDGAITSTDARLVLLVVALKYEPFPGTEEAVLFDRINKLGDVDSDGVLTSTDARLILQYYAGKITEWPNPFTIVGMNEKGDILSVTDTADGPAFNGHALHQLCVYEHGKPTTRAVTWVSADPEGITIDADGYLTHYEFGKRVLVTATLDNGQVLSHLVYTHGAGLLPDPPYLAVVTDLGDSTVQYTDCKSTLDISLADTASLQLALVERYVDTAYTGTVTWSSTMPDVASVDENGFVTLHAVGGTRIYARISETDQLEVRLRIS